MIKQVTSQLRPAFFQCCMTDPVAGCRMASTFFSYPIGEDADYWLLQDGQGHLCGALCRFDGLFTLIAGEGTPWEELVEFLLAQGCRTLEGDQASIEPLVRLWPHRPVKDWRGISMLHTGLWQQESAHSVVRSQRLRQTYQVIAASQPDMLERQAADRWYWDMNHRMRHGHVEIFEICQEEVPVSTAGLYGFAGRYSYLGCVSTLECCRKKGYASALVGTLVNRSLQKGVLPSLVCGEESLVPFYERLGFRVLHSFATLSF